MGTSVERGRAGWWTVGQGIAVRFLLLLVAVCCVGVISLQAAATAGASSGAFGSLAASNLSAFSTVNPAEAPSYQRTFKQVFGSTEQPTFEWPSLLAVDPTTGDVLVGDFRTQAISRFHADGTPAPFAALGTNTIDGEEVGGKPCAEEPASCDKTPQNKLEIEFSAELQQIAVAPDGDIYITQHNIKRTETEGLVDIFSAEGRYLGQLTATKGGNFEDPCGVAVDSAGTVYVATRQYESNILNSTGVIATFASAANPPVNADNTATFTVAPLSGHRVCHLALGNKSSIGSLFAAEEAQVEEGRRRVLAINTDTGEHKVFAEDFGSYTVVDPTTGNPLLGVGGVDNTSGMSEFDGADESVSPGEPLSRLISQQGQIIDVASSETGEMYTVVGPPNPGVFVYGSPELVATVMTDPVGAGGTKAILSGTVDPSGLPVSECFFEWGETTSYGQVVPCEGAVPTDSKAHGVHVGVSGLTANGKTYHFRLAARDEHGIEYSADRSFATAHTVVTEAASVTSATEARLNGLVRPEGLEYSECFFEYGVSSKAGYEHTVPCDPSASAIEQDFNPHSVTATLGELQTGVTYRYRLVAASSEGVSRGEPVSFVTYGPPQVSEVRALDAWQSGATIEAEVDPAGYGTSYRFEWGPTTAYGNSVPADFQPYLGAGTTPVHVSANLTGLAAGTVYHYRVVATNTAGGQSTTASADQQLETLDTCGLPDGRCMEMASPREPGPVAEPGRKAYGGIELPYQVGTEPGSLDFAVEAGLSGVTRGAETLYGASRSQSGWESTQLSPPASEVDQQSSESSVPSEFYGLSSDLRCGVLGSTELLTSDPVARLIVEGGGGNLYRRNPDGSYTLITNVPPEELKRTQQNLDREFELLGMSSDCGRVVFSTEHHYSGVPGVGAKARVYEWSQAGGLKYLGWVPGSGGEQPVATVKEIYGAVSRDGSRVFFQANRLVAGNPGDPEEVGSTGVFVREDGSRSWDVSASKTATADSGASYAASTPDGSRVYFTANHGLTSESSGEGNDLYECQIVEAAGGGHECDLRDLSVTSEPEGANVRAVLGVAEDGSHVYFESQQQLVPGRGNTLAQNQAEETWSVYDESNGTLSFVGTYAGSAPTLASYWAPEERSSRVSPDGRYLLFESRANVTGYDSGGIPEAYLYDAEAPSGEQATICVSCRQDGKPSVAQHVTIAGDAPLSKGFDSGNTLYEPQSLVFGEGNVGDPEAFFESRDKLAPGAGEGEWSLYEWSHNQVFRIASEPTGYNLETLGNKYLPFFGASTDGTDMYFDDPAALNWENPEDRYAVWDARVGGGFSEPPPSPAGCQAASEGSCQGTVSPAVPLGTPGSSTFAGEGNATFVPKAQKVAPSKAKSVKRGKVKKRRSKRRRGKPKKRVKAKRVVHVRKAGRGVIRNGGAGK